MTAYAINKVCFLAERNAAFRERLRQDVEAAVQGFKLDAEEVRALKEGDVVTLFQRGAHPFLLQHLARHRISGLDITLYRQRITSLNAGS